MSVEFWIGPAGSGKTHRCFVELRKLEGLGRRAYLLVPEQFTYSADRLLLDEGLPGARHVRVLSFQRLAFLLESEHGAVPPTLERGGREMFLRLVLDAMGADELGPFAGQAGREGFVQELSRTLRDLKVHSPNRGSVAERLSTIEGAPPGPEGKRSIDKVRTLARIIARYEELLRQAGLRDPEERLERAAAAIDEAPGGTKNLEVFVDGFMSFTVPELRILTALARTSSRFVLTLCVEPRDLSAYRESSLEASDLGLPCPDAGFPQTVYGRVDRPVFSPTARTLLLAERAFAEDGIRFTTRTLSERPRFRHASPLARIEQEALRTIPWDETSEPTTDEPSVDITAAVHPEQEVLAWARCIDRWVRLGELQGEERSARYGDVAILLRDPKAYSGLIREIFPRYRIPYFLDLTTDLTYHPLPATLLAVLDVILRRWNRSSVMALLRSPLLGLTPLEADLVENVSLEYGIEFRRWYESPWKAYILPPRRKGAHLAGSDVTDEDRDALEEEVDEHHPPSGRNLEIQRAQIDLGNRVRSSILARVRRYEEEWRAERPTFRQAGDGLLRLAEDLGLLPRLETWSSSDEERSTTRQVLNSFSAFLENGIRLMGDVGVTPALFSDLLRSGLSALRLSRTPQSLDAVLIGDFQRSRINEAMGVVIGGLTAESVPRTVPDRPLLTPEEEQWMGRAGLASGPSAQARQDEEAYLTYIAFTRARNRLLFTYPASTTTGDSLHVSPYLSLLAKRTGVDLPAPSPDAGREGLQTTEEVVTFLGTSLSDRIAREESSPEPVERTRQESFVEALYDETLRSDPPALHTVRRALVHRRPWRLDGEILSLLYPGRELVTSPSALETFCKCPYQSFAKRNLRLEPRPEAIVQPRDTGKALHDALEELLGKGEPPAPEHVEKKLTTIFNELKRDQEYLAFDLDAPSRYQWESGRRGLARFADAEVRRLQMAQYVPGRAELDFGFVEERPFLVVPAREQGRILIRGRMDRVDIPRTANWDAIEPGATPAVVLDYKRRFPRLSVRTEIEKGERLQNGIYMLALRDVFGLRPVGGFYVGILPLPVPPDKLGKPGNPLNFEFRGVILGEEVPAYDPEGAYIAALGRGGKTMLDRAQLDALLDLTQAYISDYGGRILDGEIRAVPLQRSGAGLPRTCEYCEYRDLCRFDAVRDPVLRAQAPPPAVEGLAPGNEETAT